MSGSGEYIVRKKIKRPLKKIKYKNQKTYVFFYEIIIKYTKFPFSENWHCLNEIPYINLHLHNFPYQIPQLFDYFTKVNIRAKLRFLVEIILVKIYLVKIYLIKISIMDQNFRCLRKIYDFAQNYMIFDHISIIDQNC